jgi:hypothetical protein
VLAVALFIAMVWPGSAIVTQATAQFCRLGFGLGAFALPFLLAAWGASFFVHEQVVVGRARLIIGITIIFFGALSLISLNTVGATGATGDPLNIFEPAALVSHGGYVGGAIAWVFLELVGFAIGMVFGIGAIIAGAVLIGFSLARFAERIIGLFTRRSADDYNYDDTEAAPDSAYQLAIPDAGEKVGLFGRRRNKAKLQKIPSLGQGMISATAAIGDLANANASAGGDKAGRLSADGSLVGAAGNSFDEADVAASMTRLFGDDEYTGNGASAGAGVGAGADASMLPLSMSALPFFSSVLVASATAAYLDVEVEAPSLLGLSGLCQFVVLPAP